MSIEQDGWDYTSYPAEGEDARKLVTLEESGMVWVGIRAWHHSYKRWFNNGEPERARVIAWQDLPLPAKGFFDRGILHIPKGPL